MSRAWQEMHSKFTCLSCKEFGVWGFFFNSTLASWGNCNCRIGVVSAVIKHFMFKVIASIINADVTKGLPCLQIYFSSLH